MGATAAADDDHLRSDADHFRDAVPPWPTYRARLSRRGSRRDRRERGRRQQVRRARWPSLALLDCIRLTGERLTIAGAAITAYDPDFDPENRTLAAGRAVAHEIVRGIRSEPTSGVRSEPLRPSAPDPFADTHPQPTSATG